MYKVVYDISETFFSDYHALFFYIFFYLITIISEKRASIAKKKILIFRAFAFIICLGITIYLYANFVYLCNLLREGKVGIVEGRVENFIPMYTFSKKSESFTVSNKYFQYNRNVLGNGYRKVYGEGGYIREGLQVRIHYFEGKILKLEIEE